MRHDLHLTDGRKYWLAAAACGLAMGFSANLAAASPPGEMGVWINHTGKGAVEIRPCGATGPAAKRLCGFIVWLKEPNRKTGEPFTDARNPDASKRRRTICGLPVLGSLQRVSEGYDNGWVYNPEEGAQFDAAIQLASRDRLVLTGYKGVKFFSKSFTWKRAPADLPRCDQQEAKASPAETHAAAAPKTAAAAPPQLIAPRPVPAVRPAPVVE